MKHYKVWVKVSIEEHDDETDDYRDVTDHNGEIQLDPDPEQIGMGCPGGYEEAKGLAAGIVRRLSDAF